MATEPHRIHLFHAQFHAPGNDTATAAPPRRTDVPQQDRWDLTRIFSSDGAWREAFEAWQKRIPEFARFRGTLHQGPEQVLACLRFEVDHDREGEKLGEYAFLRYTEDVGDPAGQGMKSRFVSASSEAAEAASFIRPEILALPEEQLRKLIEDPTLAEFRTVLERLYRRKPHTLSEGEERLLALGTQSRTTPRQVFDQLNDTDLDFGRITLPDGSQQALTHGSFQRLLHRPERELRREAFEQFYAGYQAHANTFAASLAGSIHTDLFLARARNFPSCREAALFEDNVPLSVYDGLVSTVREHLPAVHRYYELRRKAMGLAELRFYDTYVPILSDLQTRHAFEEAVDLVLEALKPLGDDYVNALAAGLSQERWVDRYENKGKYSGAFSAGSYDSPPYILMNYEAEVLNHVFTLAHEAGHSMHSYLSARAQPFQYYAYTIFVAEVASTFNEELLSDYLLRHASDDRQRAYLINRELDDIRGTIVRQTMFAEFERATHDLAERGEPLTREVFTQTYRELLEAYLGPQMAIDDELSLECLRIPHFYRAFYVYKYATGMSAAIALAQRVQEGGDGELQDYLRFLQGGGSAWPLDLLRSAGVDMAQPEPVQTAMQRFASLVEELEGLLGV